MSNFYYEHIGHMQCSVITLELLKELYNQSNTQINFPCSIVKIINYLKTKGYKQKIIESEIDRFFYGGLAQEIGDDTCVMTYIGKDYYEQLLIDASNQKNKLGFLIRPSKRRNRYSVTVQDTTFYNKKIYEVINKYSLRSGGARDFIKSMDLFSLNGLIKELSLVLEDEIFQINNFDDLINLVKSEGKYWSSVGGKYSWIIFAQKYNVKIDMVKYEKLVNTMRHPTEWGGRAKDLSYNEVKELLDDDATINEFIDNIVIRKLKNGYFRLTCPGYLMHERVKKGPILEFELLKSNIENNYKIQVCKADDCNYSGIFSFIRNEAIMRYCDEGSIEDLLKKINFAIEGQATINYD